MPTWDGRSLVIFLQFFPLTLRFSEMSACLLKHIIYICQNTSWLLIMLVCPFFTAIKTTGGWALESYNSFVPPEYNLYMIMNKCMNQSRALLYCGFIIRVATSDVVWLRLGCFFLLSWHMLVFSLIREIRWIPLGIKTWRKVLVPVNLCHSKWACFFFQKCATSLTRTLIEFGEPVSQHFSLPVTRALPMFLNDA